MRLTDSLISKRHARITVGETVEITDMNSANGLLMGGEQVARTALSSVSAGWMCGSPTRSSPSGTPASPWARPSRS
ncbi:FHA domain-containing protein, partial [Escherichia coli]|uniref:FHA domain-containing protein n=3 Tax=Enterobacteriaceae TaxID=543 RepID=UPI003C6CD802